MRRERRERKRHGGEIETHTHPETGRDRERGREGGREGERQKETGATNTDRDIHIQTDRQTKRCHSILQT